MQVDGQQQPQTAASDRAQDMHSMQTPDLTPREGVGRCYYTQLPRLVKVTSICIVDHHPMSTSASVYAGCMRSRLCLVLK